MTASIGCDWCCDVAGARCLNSYDTGDTTVKTTNTHCMTLRIPPELDLLVSDAAYEARQSKASWIRAAIHQRLARVRRTEPSMREPVLR